MFFLIIKYDPSGKEVWTASYEGQWGADNQVAGIVVDGSGNVIVSGSFCSIGEGIFDKDYTTLKYNSKGILQWAARFNGPGNNTDEPAVLAVDESGNVYVTGSSTIASGDGSCYATVKYDNSGVQQWVAIYNSPQSGWSYPTAFAVDDSGCVYVTGVGLAIESYSDYATIKYNTFGEEQWIAHYNGPENSIDEATAIAFDRSGSVYVTGSSTGSGTGYDFATIKYNTNGIEQWVAVTTDLIAREIFLPLSPLMNQGWCMSLVPVIFIIRGGCRMSCTVIMPQSNMMLLALSSGWLIMMDREKSAPASLTWPLMMPAMCM